MAKTMRDFINNFRGNFKRNFGTDEIQDSFLLHEDQVEMKGWYFDEPASRFNKSYVISIGLRDWRVIDSFFGILVDEVNDIFYPGYPNETKDSCIYESAYSLDSEIDEFADWIQDAEDPEKLYTILSFATDWYAIDVST